MKSRVSVTIRGRVQGVAFRHHTCRQAEILGVSGWVRNLPDGAVEGLFEGDGEAVQALVAWCRSGPPAAAVERVDIRQEEYCAEFTGFSIRY